MHPGTDRRVDHVEDVLEVALAAGALNVRQVALAGLATRCRSSRMRSRWSWTSLVHRATSGQIEFGRLVKHTRT